MNTLSDEYLHECFSLDGDSLIWKLRPRHHFATDKEFNRWNTRYAQTLVHYQNWKSYKCARIVLNGKRVKFAIHRLIFAYVHGEWPVEVDHKDLNRTNNQPDNLRAASSRENKGNTRPHSGHGIKGICFEPSRNKWKASIRDNGKRINLGRFDSAADAHAAYVLASVRVFGEFARAV